MKKTKVRMEYMLKGGSSSIVWSIISTPSGLETWFADKVTSSDKIFTFRWGKTESRQAEVVGIRTNSYIRFPKVFYVLNFIRICKVDDLQHQVFGQFIIVDFQFEITFAFFVVHPMEADITIGTDEIEDVKDLWESDIEKLKRVSGL